MFLFDTDTLSEILKRTPSPGLLAQLATMRSEDQFTTFITIGEWCTEFIGAIERNIFYDSLKNRCSRWSTSCPSIVPLLKPSVAFAPNWSEPGYPWRSRI